MNNCQTCNQPIPQSGCDRGGCSPVGGWEARTTSTGGALTDEQIRLIAFRASDKCDSALAQAFYVAREVERHYLSASPAVAEADGEDALVSASRAGLSALKVLKESFVDGTEYARLLPGLPHVVERLEQAIKEEERGRV